MKPLKTTVTQLSQVPKVQLESEPLVDLATVCQSLGITENRVRKLVRMGYVATVRIRGGERYLVSSVRAGLKRWQSGAYKREEIG